MSPDDAARDIRRAVKALESGTDDQAKEAFAFLKQVPRGYSVALEEFRLALGSSSKDVRMEAASNLGRFGRQAEWVVSALELAFVSEGDEFVRCRIAGAVGNLKTAKAVGTLVTLLEREVERALDSMALESICKAIEAAGPMAIVELARIEQIIDQVAKGEGASEFFSESLNLMRRSILDATRNAYHSFLMRGERALDQYPLLGRDPVTRSSEPLTVGRYRVIFDGRVDYVAGAPGESASPSRGEGLSSQEIGASKRNEIRCVVMEEKPGVLLCIAVWDHFSSLRLMTGFGSLIDGVTKAFNPMRIQFGIFEPSGHDSLPHQYIRVQACFNEELDEFQVADWMHDQDLATDLGVGVEDIRALFGKHPVVPSEFLVFIGGQIHDEFMRGGFAEQFQDSPQGRLDYAELRSEFCDQVRDALRTGEVCAERCPPICGDSFDAPENEEFFAQALPEGIKDIVLQCHQLVEMWRADPERSVQEDEAFLDWPDLESIPVEYRIGRRRPFEVEVAESTGQITLNLDPRQFGLVAFRCRRGDSFYEVTNVPLSVCVANSLFSWCELGSYSLALNVLNMFIPPGLDGYEAIKGKISDHGLPFQTFASRTAHGLAQAFEREIITQLPIWGGVVSPRRIRAWILDRLAQL